MVFTANGHPYTIEGTLNKAPRKVNLKFQCPEHTYTLDLQLATGDHYGITVTGDVEGPVEARALIKKDYTDAEFVVKHKATNYAFTKTKGQAVLHGFAPQSFNYQAKYTIMDGVFADEKVNRNFLLARCFMKKIATLMEGRFGMPSLTPPRLPTPSCGSPPMTHT